MRLFRRKPKGDPDKPGDGFTTDVDDFLVKQSNWAETQRKFWPRKARGGPTLSPLHGHVNRQISQEAIDKGMWATISFEEEED